VAACYLGEGAASEGDFPTALNFAATLKCQTVFLLRNNKYAISTPVEDQYASDGVVPRAIAMGLTSARVDGNDALACLYATQQARKFSIENGKPYFLEFMTYRLGDHSTSDNSTLYRNEDERTFWREKNDPIKRLTKFLKNVNYSDIPDEAAERAATRKIVTETLHKCYKHKYPSVLSVFDDVYDKLPSHLEEQKAELKAHLETYGHKYDFLDKFSKE
jgi:2-oxoisovalerate dehydrogenase E1 component alpha subunit